MWPGERTAHAAHLVAIPTSPRYKVMTCCGCTRFANTADMLAVGDGDGTLHIFQRRDGTAAVEFGCKRQPDRENWQLLWRAGNVHEMNVFDLAWSTQDAWIATAGLDNKVRILCSRSHNLLQTLNCDAPVKGVAWNPESSLLTAQVAVSAEQSAGRHVMLWETSTWQSVPVDLLQSCFESRGEQPSYMRHSWSPDGHWCMLANARLRHGKQAQPSCVAAWCRLDGKEHRQLVLDNHVRGREPPPICFPANMAVAATISHG